MKSSMWTGVKLSVANHSMILCLVHVRPDDPNSTKSSSNRFRTASESRRTPGSSRASSSERRCSTRRLEVTLEVSQDAIEQLHPRFVPGNGVRLAGEDLKIVWDPGLN